MKHIIYPGEANDYIGTWVANKLKLDVNRWDSYQAFGVIKEQELIAGVILNRFNGNDITLHVASIDKAWLSKEFLYHLFHYVFDVCGCLRCTSLVDAKNIHVLDFDNKLGFIQEGKARKAGRDGDDLIILGMLREECRFLELKRGKNDVFQQKAA